MIAYVRVREAYVLFAAVSELIFASAQAEVDARAESIAAGVRKVEARVYICVPGA